MGATYGFQLALRFLGAAVALAVALLLCSGLLGQWVPRGEDGVRWWRTWLRYPW